MPEVSVIMTTFNSGKYITNAVQSILEQTFNDFEMIIVDGGSKDDTIEKIRKFIEEGLRRSAQLNYGIANASGKFIAIMDSDDIALLDRLKLQSGYMNINSRTDVIGSFAYLVDESCRNINVLKRPMHNNKIKEHLLAMNGMSFPTCFFKKKLAVETPFNEKLVISEDLEWFLRISQHAIFANLSIPLMKLRQVKNSRSRSYRNKDKLLLSSMEDLLKKRLLNSKIYTQKAEILRNLGIINYYYGSLRKARNYLLDSFYVCPINMLTLRYLIPALILPVSIFEKIRETKIFRSLATVFRRIFAL